MTYKQRLDDLVKKCEERGLTVKFVADRHTRDYLGMNTNAARAMGYTHCGRPMPSKTIFVDSHLSDKDKYSVLKHEVREMDLMANKNMKYFEAHRIALNEE